MSPRQAGITEALLTWFKGAEIGSAARVRAMTFLRRPESEIVAPAMNAIRGAKMPAMAPLSLTPSLRNSYASSVGKGMMSSGDPRVQSALTAARAMHA